MQTRHRTEFRTSLRVRNDLRQQIGRALLVCLILCSTVPPTSATGVNRAVAGETREVAASTLPPSDDSSAGAEYLAIQRPAPSDLGQGRSLKEDPEVAVSVVTTDDTKGLLIERNKFYRSRQEAVALATKELPSVPASRYLGTEHSNNEFSRFGAAFTEAKVPDCLHKDGLKRQPPRILFFAFQGVLAFPFVALAKVRGKCL